MRRLAVVLVISTIVSAVSTSAFDQMQAAPPAQPAVPKIADKKGTETPALEKFKDHLLLERPERAVDEAVRRALRVPCAVDVQNKSLEETVRSLAREWKVKVSFDEPALAQASIKPGELVTGRASNVSRHAVLRMLLRKARLDYFIDREVITITTIEKCAEHPVSRSYDVALQTSITYLDLVNGDGQIPPELMQQLKAPQQPNQMRMTMGGTTLATLRDCITSTVDPGSWDGNGGHGTLEEAGAAAKPGQPLRDKAPPKNKDQGVGDDQGMTVRNTEQVQYRIYDLLDELRAIQKRHPALANIKFPEGYTSTPAYETDESLRKALKQRCSIDVQAKPLDATLRQLSLEWHVNITIDEKALRDADLQPGVPVTAQAKSATRRAALLQLLNPRLDYFVENGILTVTTPEQVKEHYAVRVYDVTGRTFRGNFVSLDGDAFIEQLHDRILPQSWSVSGGGGIVRADGHCGSFIILNSEEAHEKVGNMINGLPTRRIRTVAAPAAGQKQPVPRQEPRVRARRR